MLTTRRAHVIRFVVAAAGAAAVIGGATAAAGASQPDVSASAASAANGSSTATRTTLAEIKAKAAAEVDRRVHDLNAAVSKANAAKGLGAGQGLLVAYLGTDITPLTQLNQTIQSDTSVQQARRDFSSIFSQFRVYVLVLPAGRIAGDADRATATVLPALTSAAAKAQQHVNARNQASLQPLIDDLKAQIATASSATNGLAATVLAFTPAQWNANHGVLSGARTADQQADAALQKGRADVRSIRLQLRGA